MNTSRLAAGCGIAGLMVFYGSLSIAIALSPTFDWTTSALSDLGAVGVAGAWLFNGGLILSAIFFLAFSYGVFASSANRLERIGALVVSLAYALTILVGVFPYPTPLHDPIALAQFLLIPVALLLYGTGNVRRGAPRLGAVTIVLGFAAFAGNVALLAVAAAGPSGYALPELAVILPFDLWALLTIRRLYRVEGADRTADGPLGPTA